MFEFSQILALLIMAKQSTADKDKAARQKKVKSREAMQRLRDKIRRDPERYEEAKKKGKRKILC